MNVKQARALAVGDRVVGRKPGALTSDRMTGAISHLHTRSVVIAWADGTQSQIPHDQMQEIKRA